MPNEQQNQSTQKTLPSGQDNAGKVGFNSDKDKPIAEKNAAGSAKDGACSTSGDKSSQYGAK